MAHIATIKILVDEESEANVCDGINEMLRTAQQPVEEGGKQWIVDWAIHDVSPTPAELDDSIANDTYAEGEAFSDWVLFSASEAAASGDGAGFWSNEFGWTTLDLATKFDANGSLDKPISTGNDVIWMLAPYSLRPFRIILVEKHDQDNLDQTPISFDCFAEHSEHAEEQAESAYPGCTILGLESELVEVAP